MISLHVQSSGVTTHSVYLCQSVSECASVSLPQQCPSTSQCRCQRQRWNSGLYRRGEHQHGEMHIHHMSFFLLLSSWTTNHCSSFVWIDLLSALRMSLACVSSTSSRCPAAANTGVSTSVSTQPGKQVCLTHWVIHALFLILSFFFPWSISIFPLVLYCVQLYLTVKYGFLLNLKMWCSLVCQYHSLLLSVCLCLQPQTVNSPAEKEPSCVSGPHGASPNKVTPHRKKQITSIYFDSICNFQWAKIWLGFLSVATSDAIKRYTFADLNLGNERVTLKYILI